MIGVLFLLPSCLFATTLYVPDDYPEIQDAIEAASEGDTVLVGPGSYGAVDFLGKNIVVLSEEGPDSTYIVPGGDYGNVMFVNGESSDAVLQGFDISNGGRGIYIEDSSPTVRGNHISGHYNGYAGGGILASGSQSLIQNNVIIGNSTMGGSYTNYGAGVCLSGGSSVTLQNNVIAENESFLGSGVCLLSGGTSASLVNNVIAYNPAECHIYLQYSSSSIFIRNCILWGSNWVEIEAYGEDAEIDIAWSDIKNGKEGIWGGSLTWGDGMISDTPVFVAGPYSDYQLDESLSPCVDAGDPAPEFNDPEDPANPGFALYPALGLVRNDMGAYGGGGVGFWVGIEQVVEPPGPDDNLLLQAFPNPFRGSATIVFELAEPGEATLQVHDLSGRLVETLFAGEMVNAQMSCFFDGGSLPSGVYMVLLRTEDSSAAHRLILLR